MRQIDLGQTIQILANIGGIAGIVFLAFEISQNNELLCAEADNNDLQRRIDERLRIRIDPDFAGFAVRERNGELHGPVQKARSQAGMEATLLIFQWQYGQLTDGNLSESREQIVARWRSDFERMLTTPTHVYHAILPPFRETLRPEFARFWEEQFVAYYK